MPELHIQKILFWMNLVSNIKKHRKINIFIAQWCKYGPVYGTSVGTTIPNVEIPAVSAKHSQIRLTLVINEK